MIPYPPSFNKIAARIIDPSSGASTWAFGNHKCVINIGIFTRKAINKSTGKLNLYIITIGYKNDWNSLFKIILINKGNEAVIVYIIR